ncbi:MAG: sulfite exporter TauE/SafE family protein [Spartobacteria bacterium]|nr:sulfite exporter TauE/SafE family protein [Spartobacteria bacterium]
MTPWMIYAVIGLLAGVAGGLFGLGGGVIVVPLLIYWAKFPEHRAVGTSLVLLLPPLGLAGAIEFYRHGNVDIRAGVIIGCVMLIGIWMGSCLANRIRGPYLRLMFAVFILLLGAYLVYGACQRLGWIGGAK